MCEWLVLTSTLGMISCTNWKFIFRGSDYKERLPLPLSLFNNNVLLISAMGVQKRFSSVHRYSRCELARTCWRHSQPEGVEMALP